MSTRAVDITLLGRTYSIACPAGQEDALRSVADKLEKQLNSVKTRTNNLSREEIAIMAALNIGYELLEEQAKNQDYMKQMDDRISLLQTTLENALVEQITTPLLNKGKKTISADINSINDETVSQIKELSIGKE